METRQFLWRLSAFMLFGIALAAVFTFTSCSDDEEPEEDPTLAGVYQMQEAILTSDIVDVEDSVVIPSGSNVTAIMGGGIFGASPCDDPTNTAVDMRDDGKLFFVCVGSESGKQGVDAGSWEENVTLTTLTLDLNATVVPPIGYSLSITSVSKTGTAIDGTIGSVPMPNTLLNQVVGLEDVEFPAVTIASATVKFVEAQ
jgi:hypothetical protein